MKKQWISAILMTIIGGGIYAASASYKPQPASVLIPETESIRETTALPSDSPGTKEPPSAAVKEDEEDIFRPSAEELNLTHFFPEGADPGDISQSYAGKAFQELVIQDEEWMNGIYIYADMTPEQFAARTGEPRSRVMGSYNPKDDQHDPDNPDTWAIHSFRNIRTNVTNGDGSPISAYSNVIEIMSLANVYTFYKDTGNYDLFLSYAKSLWERSHSYSVGMSDVYYCEGCLSEEDERARLEREAAAEEEAVKAAMAGTDNGPDRESGAEGEQKDTTAESKARVITAPGSTQTSEENAAAGTDNDTAPGSSPVLIAGENEKSFPNDDPGTSPSGTEEQIPQEPQESSTGNENQGTGLPENPPAITGRDNSADEARTTGEDLSAGEVSPSGISGVSPAGGQSSDTSASFPAEGQSADTSASFPAEGQSADTSASFPAEGQSADTSASFPAEGRSSDTFASFPAEEPSAGIAGVSSAEEQASDIPGTSLTDQPTHSGQERCPGHVDLLVQMKIRGLKEENGLFKADRLGNAEENYEENGWQGWTEAAVESARSLASQDWYQRYGITVSSISMRNPLTSYEIEEYMDRLPEDLSQTRKEIIRFALSSVGKVPYYWGGKPSAPNYARNGFGTLVSPDEKGRVLRGLDCSGWINWVYWSVTGNRLPHESTSGLALCGSPVSRDHLQPGDIVIRTGEDAHVIMFLEWTEDGSIRCIHESSANINNVTVGIRDANWPYYRKLID